MVLALDRLQSWRVEVAQPALRVLGVDPTDLKAYAIAKYGGRCYLCGQDDIDILGITHPDTVKCGIHKYRWLRANHWPPGGRVVCSTCTGSLVRKL